MAADLASRADPVAGRRVRPRKCADGCGCRRDRQLNRTLSLYLAMCPIRYLCWSAVIGIQLFLLQHSVNARVLLVDPEDITEVRLLNEKENERPFETMQYRSIRRRDDGAVQTTSKPLDPLEEFLGLFGIRPRSSDSTPKLVPRTERPPLRFDPIGDLLKLAGSQPDSSTPAPSLVPRSEKKTPDFDPFRDLIQLPVLKGTEQAISAADSVRQQFESINPLQNLFSPPKIIQAQDTTTQPQPIVPLNGLSNLVLKNDSSSTSGPREGPTRLNGAAIETDIRKMFPPIFNLLDNLGVPARDNNLDEIQIGRDRTVSVLGMPVGRRDGVKVAPLDGLTLGNQDVYGPIAVNDNYKVNWGFLGEIGKFLDLSTKEIERFGGGLSRRTDHTV